MRAARLSRSLRTSSPLDPTQKWGPNAVLRPRVRAVRSVSTGWDSTRTDEKGSLLAVLRAGSASRRPLPRIKSLECACGLPPNQPRGLGPALALLPLSLDSLPSLTSLTEPISDFLLTHPTLGSYSLTIILLTLSLRTFLTLPANLWARARMGRMRRLVVPEMRRWNEVLAKKVAGESRRDGLGYEAYKKELKRQLAAQQSILVRKHKCHPLLTAIAPIGVHIPSFILLSLGIRGAVAKASEAEVLLQEGVGRASDQQPVVSPSAMTTQDGPLDQALSITDLDLDLDLQLISPLTHAFANESFFHCPTLVDTDPTLIVPFLIGIAVFANVEVMGMWREGLREMRAGGEVANGSAGQGVSVVRGAASATNKNGQGEVIDKGRDWMGRRVLQVKPHDRPSVPQYATSSINATRRGAAYRPQLALPTPNTALLQDETDVGNMTAEELAQRGNRIETATLRERVVGNVLRGFAVVVVGLSSEMPVAVAIYWLTSTTYTLVQNWLFGWSDQREETAVVESAVLGGPTKPRRRS